MLDSLPPWLGKQKQISCYTFRAVACSSGSGLIPVPTRNSPLTVPESIMSTNTAPSPRTRLVREPQRAVYDRDEINAILDEAFICHVGFVVDGQPFVIPTGYGRSDDHLYIHGSAASRMLRNVEKGIPVCVTVTLLDGLVLARSIFNHSMNYRSVVVLGTALAVEDPEEKIRALELLSEHIIPGRWAESRYPNEKELKATTVLRLPLSESSAKVRMGPPIDDEEDYSFETWAGVIPLSTTVGAPIPDERCDREAPTYVKQYSRSKRE
jgi:nitroimidazol reductase NimA-like FMN-containing flavoprotein (pyridoxamine 5'-phosphate oxidase superfamily)